MFSDLNGLFTTINYCLHALGFIFFITVFIEVFMKWAVDKLLERNLINGWIAANDGNSDSIYYVSIRTPEKVIYTAAANLERPDVKAANLHTSGFCGFSFNAKSHDVKEGDLLFVELFNDDKTERFTHSFLYSTNVKTNQLFEEFEVPRDDFSIMEKDTYSILREYPHWIVLKILLIRLRRNKRAKGWRGQFSGVEYNYRDSDWKLFYHIVSVYREAIFNNLTIRNIFSITDTIADFSTPLERCAAQSLSMLMFHERFAQTIYPLCHINDYIYIKPHTQHPIWDGMLSNRLELDDALDIYLTRACEVLQQTPFILCCFKHIILKSMSEKNSIFHVNISHSHYFTNAWSFYKARFERDLKDSLSNI